MANEKDLRRRQRRRMNKKDRQNTRLWAEGCREALLTPHVAPYADALARGWVHERDYLAKVQNHYHQVIPWHLPDNEEPPLPLPEYNPHLVPPHEDLSEEEKKLKSQIIAKKNDSIRRWLKYRARKMSKTALKTDSNPEKNPFAALLAKLSGVTNPPQRARQGWQQFMHERNDDAVGPAVAALWAEKQARGLTPEDKNNMAYRAEIARDLFKKLSSSEQATYAANAKRDKEAAVKKYKKDVEEALSKTNRSPAQRQLCLQNVAAFMSPIMQGLKDMTGYNWVLLGGGPDPQHGGDISTVHLNAGFNLSHVPMYWRQWDEKRFDDSVVSFFKEYLDTCFSADDCAGAALPKEYLDAAQFTIPPDQSASDGNSGDWEHSDSDSDDSDASDSSTNSDLPSPVKSKPSKVRAPAASDAPVKQTKARNNSKRKRTGSDVAKASKRSKAAHSSSSNTSPLQTIPTLPQHTPAGTPSPPPSAVTTSLDIPSPPPSAVTTNLGITSPPASAVMASRGDGTGPLSDYERDREANIARNQRMLASLDIAVPFADAKLAPTTAKTKRPRPVAKSKPSVKPAQRRITRGSAAKPLDEAQSGSGVEGEGDIDMSVSDLVGHGACAVPGDVPVVDAAPIAPPLHQRAAAPAAPLVPSHTPHSSAFPHPPPAALSVQGPAASPPNMTQAPLHSVDASIAISTPQPSPAPQTPSSTAPKAFIPAALPTPPQISAPSKRYMPSVTVKSSWLGAPLLQITAQTLGEEYTHVLDLLCKLETAYGLKTTAGSFQAARGGKMPLKPKWLADWVKDGRGRNLKPEVLDVPAMEQSWWKYWLALQPTWRGDTPPLLAPNISDLSPSQMNWGPLVFPGLNGMLGIVACLYWWGRTTLGLTSKSVPEDKRGTLQGWRAAVSDTAYVLEALLCAAKEPQS
ncbi:hypothetical protein HWV62_28178 [Athelia sp. TMB]|nr:hypothetical protein HWV62_28178 [Athelia sp. TMB]